MSETIDTLTLLKSHLHARNAARVLDIGCGGGHLAAELTSAGFELTGIDPSEAAIAMARRTTPKAHFDVAGAEHLPFGTGAFDAAVFHNSLHHVPVAAIPAALAEAARVVNPSGTVIVVEPQARGPFFEVMRPIEDETAVRAAAVAAIGAAVAAGRFDLAETRGYERSVIYARLDDFLDYVLRVDSGRAPAVARARGEVTRLFAEMGEATPEGTRFRQPQTLWVLRPRPAAA